MRKVDLVDVVQYLNKKNVSNENLSIGRIRQLMRDFAQSEVDKRVKELEKRLDGIEDGMGIFAKNDPF